MRLLQIDYFLEVAEKLNFTKAAQALYISQPALSKQIAQLEQEIGTPLFMRTSRKVALTPAGVQLRNDLLEVRKSLNEAVERAARFGRASRKNFRIGCFDGRVSSDYLTIFCDKLAAFLPDTTADFIIHPLEQLPEKLANDEIDIIFTLQGDFEPNETQECFKVISRHTGLFYSPKMFGKRDTPISIKDFSGKNFLCTKKVKGHSLMDTMKANLQSLGITECPPIEIDNMNTMIMKLEMGQGFSLLGKQLAENTPQLCCLELDDTYDMWVIAVAKKTNTAAVELLRLLFSE